MVNKHYKKKQRKALKISTGKEQFFFFWRKRNKEGKKSRKQYKNLSEKEKQKKFNIWEITY